MKNGELYNEKTKLEYLATIESEDVKDLSYHLFQKSKSAEKYFEKDLYSFNLDQIDMVMRNINPATLNSVANNKSRINNYIRWAIKNGRRANNMNPLQGTGQEWASKFIDKVSKRHLSSTELYDLTESLHNAQDKALIQCIFEGISGHELSELTSLNVDNIDWEKNEVTVYDIKSKEPRTVKLSDRCMNFIDLAYQQQYYLSEDSELEKELMEYQGNVFKNKKWRSTMNSFVSKGNLTKRISDIKDKYGLDQFSTVTISESGRIKMAADLFRERGELTKEEFSIIGDHYNLPKTTNNGYTYYNTFIMKNYINEDNLKDLYGIEVEL